MEGVSGEPVLLDPAAELICSPVVGTGDVHFGRTVLTLEDLEGMEEIDSEEAVEEIERIVQEKCLPADDIRSVILVNWRWIGEN